MPVFTESPLIIFPLSCFPFYSTPWEVMTFNPRLVDDYSSALAGTEKLCLGKAATQMDSPEGHLAQRSKNSNVGLHRPTHVGKLLHVHESQPLTCFWTLEPRECRREVLPPYREPSRAAYPLCAAQCKHHVCNWMYGMWGIKGYLPHRSTPGQAACSWGAVFPTPAFHLTATPTCASPPIQSSAIQQLAITDGRQGGQLSSCYYYFVFGCLNYEEKTYFTLLPQGLSIQKKTNQVKLSCT